MAGSTDSPEIVDIHPALSQNATVEARLFRRQVPALLAEAGAAFAEAPDLEATLRTLARVTVPAVADWCVVDLTVADAPPRRVAIEHPDPAQTERAWKLERARPTPPEGWYGPTGVLRTGRPEIVPVNSENLEILRGIPVTSYVCAPIRRGGVRVAAFTLAWADSGRRYAAEDLDFVEELARLVEIALDRADVDASAREEEEFAEGWLFSRATAAGRRHLHRSPLPLPAVETDTSAITNLGGHVFGRLRPAAGRAEL
jgi:GAF domain-containing protein